MPLLGYLGYSPFSWELFAVFWFFAGWLLPKDSRQVKELETLIVEERPVL
jgi:hypothetical protein